MKPKRTKQVVGIIVGSSLLVGSSFVAFFGRRLAFASPGDPGMLDVAALAIGGTTIGLSILIISIVYFLRAGRTTQTKQALVGKLLASAFFLVLGTVVFWALHNDQSRGMEYVFAAVCLCGAYLAAGYQRVQR
jgi:hypothetical protein